MLMNKYYFITISFIILTFTGCSGNVSDPVVMQPGENEGNISTPGVEAVRSERSIVGMWTLNFDPEKESVSINQERGSSAHFNLTSLLPTPGIEIISYDPLRGVFDINVTITNSFNIAGYDLRLIFFTNDDGIRLVNPDNWTRQYDPVGGGYINPFKAYAKSEENRVFAGLSEHTELCQIYLPGGAGAVSIAIDASWPGNCEEPYRIDNFEQGVIHDFQGAEGPVEIDVYDWQDDVSSVILYCPVITNQSFAYFTKVNSHKWHLDVVNNAEAPAGEYFGFIMAESENSGTIALYETVSINVSPFVYECPTDSNNSWQSASGVAYQSGKSGCISPLDEDWYTFLTPPAGIQSGTFDLTANGPVEMSIYGCDPGQGQPGSLLATDTHIQINNNSRSKYYIKLTGTERAVNYNLSVNVTPKVTNVAVEVYVATENGSPSGNWPWDGESRLTRAKIAQMINWGNGIWNKYGYNLQWDGTETIMRSKYFNLSYDDEDWDMHVEYGRGEVHLSLYFVQQLYSGNTAFCRVYQDKNDHNRWNVYSVYSPNVWYWQAVVAHEKGHAIGYYFDEYKYDQAGCGCGDNGCLGYTPWLYWTSGGCYDGNMMWYEVGWGWDGYSLTNGQASFIKQFHWDYPASFPFS